MITKIIYNWHQTGDTSSGFGEDYHHAEIDEIDTLKKMEVKSIENYDDDYRIVYKNNSKVVVYNPNLVFQTGG